MVDVTLGKYEHRYTGAYKKTVTWSSSEDSLANGDTYSVNYRAFVAGFGVLFPVTF